jgi:hypothetical protein
MQEKPLIVGGHQMGEITEHGKFTTVMAKICKDNCPVCVKGREKGEGFLYNMVKLEDKLYFCPACKAYKKVYGVPAYEKCEE